MKALPVYVVTGFLSNGKTTFLNHQCELRKDFAWPAIIQCEEGIKECVETSLSLSILELEQENDQLTIVRRIKDYIQKRNATEVWIEWNGMLPFSSLEAILFHKEWHEMLDIAQVIFVTTPNFINYQLGPTGNAPLSQLANADLVVLREDAPPSAIASAKTIVKDWRKNVPILQWSKEAKIQKQLSKKKRSFTVLGPLLLILLYITAITIGTSWIPNSINQVLSIYIGILMQALPFLLLGVLTSSAIRYFIPTRWLEKLLLGNRFKSTFFALLGGILFPVCDCATIPIFRTLIIRGIPVSTAITFMLASPLLNPIVLLSTWYAFDGNPIFIASRFIIGAVVAILVGVTFIDYQGLASISNQKLPPLTFAGCNDYETNDKSSQKLDTVTLFTRHAQGEFLQVGSYFLIGALLASLFQVYMKPWMGTILLDTSIPVLTLTLMVFAFFLSLCSTSDAVIGRTLATTFPLPSILGFLLFGPMMDIKNYWMLRSFFPTTFILRLLVTTFILSFLGAMAYYAIPWGIFDS